jgi:hypothetical protein
MNVFTIGDFTVFFKGILSRDFRPPVFSSNNPILALDSRVKAILHMATNSRRYSTMKSILMPLTKIDTADQGTSKFSMLWLLLPVKRISIKKSYIGKFYHFISITFFQKKYGLTRDHFCGQRCH